MKRQMIGMAGVHLVAGELYRRGYVALMPPFNMENIDIVVIDPKTGIGAFIEVKTIEKPSNDPWLLGGGSLNIGLKNHVYVFVALYESGAHKFYIVPADYVKNNVKIHQTKSGSMYSISRNNIASYEGKWDIIERITTGQSNQP